MIETLRNPFKNGVRGPSESFGFFGIFQSPPTWPHVDVQHSLNKLDFLPLAEDWPGVARAPRIRPSQIPYEHLLPINRLCSQYLV